MKFKCSRSKLVEVINIVQRAISSKPVIPVLECIKIESTDASHVTMTGTNVELCVEYNLECDVIEGGSVALASKIFGEIIRRMPEGMVYIEVNETNNLTRIKCGASEFSIQGQDIDTFPATPIIDEQFSFYLEEESLKKLIKRALPFIALNEGKKPILTGALFEIKKNYLHVVTTDVHRMAVVKEELKENVEDAKMIVPGQTLRELLKILKDEDNKIKLIIGDRRLLFDFGEFQIYTSLLDGEFLRYEAIIATANPIKMKLSKRVFMDSLERAMLLINEDVSSSVGNKVPVRLNIGYDKLDLLCITSKGQVSDEISASVEGGNLEIGFNCRFLLDAMNVCDEEVITMEFSTKVSGCFIKSEEEGYTYMILPVRLYD